MTYLKALDNYHDVTPALVYAEKALKANPNSYTYQIIVAIIKAQKAFDQDWCEVYKLTDNVRTNPELMVDIKVEAIDLIFEYMDLYEDSCK